MRTYAPNVILLFANLFCLTSSLDNGLCVTPPMGWLSWERFGCNTNCGRDARNCISESLFMEMADRLISDGYYDVGYDRVNVDDCWMSKTRTKDGKLTPDKKRFPNGIKFLADYMHKRGLKFGIYQNYGLRTCMGFPGLIGYAKRDANTFAEWGVDMVKLDACFTPVNALDKGFVEFERLLNATERRIAFSCSWPYYQLQTSETIPDWYTISQTCNLWRTYHDIHAKWKDILATIDFAGDNQEILTRNVGHGSWNDLDMLLIGNKGLTVEQSKVQMGIWAIVAAPLFMSNDLRDISSEFRDILLNKEVIAVNQDSMAIPGKRVFHSQTLDIWVRQILPKVFSDGKTRTSFAIAFVNRKQTETALNIKVNLKELGLNGTYKFRELFDGLDLGEIHSNQKFEVSIAATGIRLYNAKINL